MAMGLSLKLAAVSATVVSTAVMFNLLAPIITNFTVSDLPALSTSLVSWLKPPYLYVVINCIIITIVASSRLQSKLDDSPSLSTSPAPVFLPPTEPYKVVVPVEAPRIHEEQEVSFHGNEPVKEAVAGYTSRSEFVPVPIPVRDLNTPQFSDEFRDEDMENIVTEAYEKLTRNTVNASVISASLSRANVSFPTEKPPASARFSHRKTTKASPEGGKTLGVAKPKRQDTLEATWKTITEGRSVPLTRHLRKSDTWETHGQGRHNINSEVDHHSERMTKSDTFDVNADGGSSRKPPAPPSKLSRSGGSGRLKKEPSLGQEELNRRVEAFIKKFNEDMRLQRQESLNQYMEMINRGAH